MASLQRKILLVLVPVLLVALFLMASISAVTTLSTFQDQMEQELTLEARRFARTLSDSVEDQEHRMRLLLQALSDREERGSKKDAQRLEISKTQIQSLWGHGNLRILVGDGKSILWSTHKQSSGLFVPDADKVRDVDRFHYFFHRDSQSGRILDSCAVLAKVLTAGKRFYYFYPGLDHFQRVLGDYHYLRSGYGWLVDENGRVIAYPEKQRILSPQGLLADAREGEREIAKRAGLTFQIPPKANFLSKEGRIVAAEPIPQRSWSAVVALPCSEFSQMAGLVVRNTGILFAVVSLLAMLLLLQAVRFVCRPAETLIEYLGVGKERMAPPDSVLRDAELSKLLLLRDHYDRLIQENQELKQADADVNPITGLVGNIALQKEIFRRIDENIQFAVGVVDIDNFASFNAKHGFQKGDGVLRHTAMILRNLSREFGNGGFLAHVGGDNFVFITTLEKVDSFCKELIQLFDTQIPSLYNEEDRKRGFIVSKDRRGNIHTFDLMTISIAVVTNEHRPIIHPLQVAQIAGELTNYLKKLQGSHYFKDRRREEREGPAEPAQEISQTS